MSLRTLLIYIAAAICYFVGLLLAADWFIHDGNVVAFAMAGSVFFVAGHISGRMP